MMKKIQIIIEYGLYVLAFVLPIQTRLVLRAGEINGGYFEYGTLSLYGTDLILVTLIFLFFIFKIKELKHLKLVQNSKFKIQNFKSILNVWFLIGGLELIIFISIFFAPDKLVAVYRYVLFLLGVGLFWILTKAIYSKAKLIYAFVLGAVLQAVLGIWQFFSQEALGFKWLGMARHLPFELGNSVIESLQGGRWLRAYGGMDHPNLFGGYLVVGILLFLNSKLIQNSKFRILNFKFRINFKCFNFSIFKQYIFYLFLFILFLGIFLSFSRSAWLALIVGMFVIFVLSFYKKIERTQILKIVTAFFLFGIILTNIFSELIFTRFSTEARLEKKSYLERVESINVAKQVIEKNWLFGVGVGNYTQYVYGNINSDLVSWDYQPVHNVFLLVWAEIGILGLVLFVGLLLCLAASPLVRGEKHSLSKKRKFRNFVMFGVIFVLFMFDHWWWSLHFGGILFWFLMGVLNNSPYVTASSRGEREREPGIQELKDFYIKFS